MPYEYQQLLDSQFKRKVAHTLSQPHNAHGRSESQPVNGSGAGKASNGSGSGGSGASWDGKHWDDSDDSDGDEPSSSKSSDRDGKERTNKTSRGSGSSVKQPTQAPLAMKGAKVLFVHNLQPPELSASGTSFAANSNSNAASAGSSQQYPIVRSVLVLLDVIQQYIEASFIADLARSLARMPRVFAGCDAFAGGWSGTDQQDGGDLDAV